MSTELQKSIDSYNKYLQEHINNNKLVWQELQTYLTNDFFIDDYTYHNLNCLINNHDKSKYLKEEFEAYRQYFYPVANEVSNPECFNRAWNTHQKTNKHHWQYWILIEDSGNLIPLEMDFYSIIELLCDWCAMSVKFNNIPSDWYNLNIKNIILHEDTEIIINRWMPLFDKVYLNIKKIEIPEPNK